MIAPNLIEPMAPCECDVCTLERKIREACGLSAPVKLNAKEMETLLNGLIRVFGEVTSKLDPRAFASTVNWLVERRSLSAADVAHPLQFVEPQGRA